MGMGKGEHQIAALYLSRSFIKMVACAILFALRAPNITSPNLVFEGLFVVDPPEAHHAGHKLALWQKCRMSEGKANQFTGWPNQVPSQPVLTASSIETGPCSSSAW